MLTDNNTQKERNLTFPCLKVVFDRSSATVSTVETPCATTSRKRSPPISDRNPKHQNFLRQSLTV